MASSDDVKKVKNREVVEVLGGSLSLQNADFRNSDLSHIKFYRCDLSRSDFSKSQLSRVSMSDCKLIDVNLEECCLEYANLNGSNLSYANLRQANVKGAELKGVKLIEAKLQGADLSSSSLRRANLSGANLRGANLQYADLRGACLDNADLREADLQGADLFYASLSNVHIAGSNLEDVDTRAARIITFHDTPEKPVLCPQDKAQSMCVKCRQKGIGRSYGFHYGIETATERYGGGGYGSVIETIRRYKMVGYLEVFLCDNCVWRRLRNRKILPPLIALLAGLVTLALSFFFFRDAPEPINHFLPLLAFLAAFGGLWFLIIELVEVILFYRLNSRGPVEDFAKSVCGNILKDDYPNDYSDLRTFNSSQYVMLD